MLFKNELTGASDIAIDPNRPRVLFAGMWQAKRQPWTMTSGGPGSGLYRSDDGGDTWKQITEHGLPLGEMGKIGVAVARSDSNRVYALIEAKDGGLFRSDDGGEKWERASAASPGASAASRAGPISAITWVRKAAPRRLGRPFSSPNTRRMKVPV